MPGDNHEQRLAQYKADLAAVVSATARADENVTNILANMKATYGADSMAQAQDMHARVVKEIPMIETKLAGLLDQAAAALESVEQPGAASTSTGISSRAADTITTSSRSADSTTTSPTRQSRGPVRGTTRGR